MLKCCRCEPYEKEKHPITDCRNNRKYIIDAYYSLCLGVAVVEVVRSENARFVDHDCVTVDKELQFCKGIYELATATAVL